MRKISLLDLAEQLQNVSEACRLMRVSRDTFYRVKHAYEEEGIEGLREKTRRRVPRRRRGRRRIPRRTPPLREGPRSGGPRRTAAA